MLDTLLSIIFYQAITVNSTQPCFFNYTAGAQMWQNCGMSKDFLQTAMLSWDWVTGGNFTMVVVSMFILISYIKYHKLVYPLLIGVIFLPTSFYFFPISFFNFAAIMAATGIGLLIAYIFVSQTNEQ